MPNHIKNRIRIEGANEQIKEVFAKYNNHYPAEIRKSHDGDFVCNNKDADGVKYGWLNPKTGIFTRRNEEPILGLPDGWEVEIKAAFDHFPTLEKVFPTPEVLKGLEPHHGIVTAVKKKYQSPISGNPLIGVLEIQNRATQTLEFEGAEKELFEKCCKAYEETGYVYWYDWNNSNWGTKWDVYSCEREDFNTFTFETAWNAIPNAIQKISEQNPKVKIYYDYADEDTGYNCGQYVFESGNVILENIPQGGTKEAYDLAFNLRPDHADYYELVDGNYQSKDED